MRKSSVNSITYGAIFCALVGILIYINRMLANALELYFFWIIPIPIIIYILKFDTKQALVLDTSMLLMTMIIAGPISTPTFYVLGSVVCGTIYGDGLSKGKNAAWLIGSVIMCSLVMMVITTFAFSAFFGYDIQEEVNYMTTVFQQVIQNTSMDEATASTITNVFTPKFILTIVIVSYVLSSCMEGVLVHLIAYVVLKRLKMQTPPIKTVDQIYCPGWLKLIIFAGLFAGIMSGITNVTQFDDIILPLQVIAYFICYIFGYITLITYLAVMVPNKRNRSLLTLVLIALSFIFSALFVGIGLFDIFTNVRKRFIEEVRNRAQQQNGQN